jgi:hypothetical protein
MPCHGRRREIYLTEIFRDAKEALFPSLDTNRLPNRSGSASVVSR